MEIQDKYKNLCHIWCEPLQSFFKRIDDLGGWPVNYKYVQFHHSDNRPCLFSNAYVRNEWWTTVCSSDDYYIYKLSETALNNLKNQAKQELISNLIAQLQRTIS